MTPPAPPQCAPPPSPTPTTNDDDDDITEEVGWVPLDPHVVSAGGDGDGRDGGDVVTMIVDEDTGGRGGGGDETMAVPRDAAGGGSRVGAPSSRPLLPSPASPLTSEAFVPDESKSNLTLVDDSSAHAEDDMAVPGDRVDTVEEGLKIRDGIVENDDDDDLASPHGGPVVDRIQHDVDEDACIVLGSSACSPSVGGTATPAIALDPTHRHDDDSSPTAIATVGVTSEGTAAGSSASQPASQVVPMTSSSSDVVVEGAECCSPSAAADLDAAGPATWDETRSAPPQATATAIAEGGDLPPPLDDDYAHRNLDRTGSTKVVEGRGPTASTSTTTRVDCPICLDSFLIVYGGDGDGDDSEYGSHKPCTTGDESDSIDEGDDEGPKRGSRWQRGVVDACHPPSSSSSFLRGTSFDSSSSSYDASSASDCCPPGHPCPTPSECDDDATLPPRRRRKRRHHHLLYRLSACDHVMCATCLSAQCHSTVMGGGHDVRCCHPVTTATAAVDGDEAGGGDGVEVGVGVLSPSSHKCCDVSLAEDDVRTLLLLTANDDCDRGGGSDDGCIGEVVDLEDGRWGGGGSRDDVVNTPYPEQRGSPSSSEEKREGVLGAPLPDILVRYERYKFDALHGDACRRCPNCDEPHIFVMIDEDENEEEENEGGHAVGAGANARGGTTDDVGDKEGPTTTTTGVDGGGGEIKVDVDLEMGTRGGGGGGAEGSPALVYNGGSDETGGALTLKTTEQPRPDADLRSEADSDPDAGIGGDAASGGGGGPGDDDWVAITVPSTAGARCDEVRTEHDVESRVDVVEPFPPSSFPPSSSVAADPGAGGGPDDATGSGSFDGDDDGGDDPSRSSPRSSFPRATSSSTSQTDKEESVGSSIHRLIGNSSSPGADDDTKSSPLHFTTPSSSNLRHPFPIGDDGKKSKRGGKRRRIKLGRRRPKRGGGAPTNSFAGTDDSTTPTPRPRPPPRRRRRRPDTPVVNCRKCDTEFCYHHSNAHPGRTCHEYETERSSAADDRRASEAYIRSTGTIKPCPSCGIGVQKAGGCNQMKCPGCDTNFCWLCLALVDDGTFPAHFQWWNLGGCPNMQLHEGGEPSRFDVCSRRALAVAQLVLVGLPSVVLAVVSSILCCCLVPGMGGNNRDRATNCVSCWGNVITAVAFVPIALLGCVGSAVFWMATRAFGVCVDAVGRVKRRWSEKGGVSGDDLGGAGGGSTGTGVVEGGGQGGRDGMGIDLDLDLGLGLSSSSSSKGSATTLGVGNDEFSSTKRRQIDPSVGRNRFSQGSKQQHKT